jgi:hypothetical protein
MTPRAIRLAERERYLAASPYTDAEARWRRYEDLILLRYYPYSVDSRKTRRIKHALDLAWRERGYDHQRLGNKNS